MFVTSAISFLHCTVPCNFGIYTRSASHQLWCYNLMHSTIVLCFVFRKWCWYWNCIWIINHWLCKEPIPQAAVILICNFGICFVRSYGTFLSYDGIFDPLCSIDFLNVEKLMCVMKDYV